MTSTLKPKANGEHPVVAWVGIVAIVVAILLILWARVEVHGTRDLEQALSQEVATTGTAKPKPSPDADRRARDSKVEEAVAAGRWAAGFSP